MLDENEQRVLRQVEEQLSAESPDLVAEMRQLETPLVPPHTGVRLRGALCASAAGLLAVGQPTGAYVALSLAGLWQYYVWQFDRAPRRS